MTLNRVDGVEAGMGGVVACDGAFLLQSPHVSLVLLISLDISRSMLDLP